MLRGKVIDLESEQFQKTFKKTDYIRFYLIHTTQSDIQTFSTAGVSYTQKIAPARRKRDEWLRTRILFTIKKAHFWTGICLYESLTGWANI